MGGRRNGNNLAVAETGLFHGTSSGKTTRKFHFWRQLLGGGITIERLKQALANSQASLHALRLSKKEADKALDKHCIERGASIKELLRSAGPNRYNNYDKSSYRNRAEKMATATDKDTHRVAEADREKSLAHHRATPKPKIQEASYELPSMAGHVQKVARLLQTTVVSATILSLKGDQHLSSWMHQGLALHRSRHSQDCLFCEQLLPESRVADLEAHFSAQYDQFLESVDTQIAALQAASTAVESISLPNRAEFYDDLSSQYEAARNVLTGAQATTVHTLDALIESLTKKRARAFEGYGLGVVVPEVASDAVERVNDVIQQHNSACDAFETRAGEARVRLEADSIAHAIDEFQELVASAESSESSVGEAIARSKQISDEISVLEREIVEHRKPADELNDDLRKYLGHDELRLEVKDTGYSVSRNGAPAHSLSEGEKTALALLYFLKCLQDRRKDLSQSVVVLDDPVSSLDANAMYLAFGFIRQRTQDAAQLFILTHNFTFFRQVRNWFHNLRGPNKKAARFYMLDFVRQGSQRCSIIRRLDPLLEQYESEYHYLFARIYREAKDLSAPDLAQNYVLPNMARRLLEAFLAFRRPQVSGELWQKMKDVNFDEAKKLRVLRFLNAYSHCNAMADPEHDPSLLAEARSVLVDLLDFMEDQDRDHFAAMVEIIERVGEALED